jgi:hypothetical protein
LAAITLILMTVSMVAVGVLVWNVLSRQERGDSNLHGRLDADDARAAKGREEFAKRRAAARAARESKGNPPTA